jgi:hypothetical protein
VPLKRIRPDPLYTINWMSRTSPPAHGDGAKVEALLKVTASNVGHWIGVTSRSTAFLRARLRKRATAMPTSASGHIDEARSKFGFDLGGLLTGRVPIKLSGRVAPNDGEPLCRRRISAGQDRRPCPAGATSGPSTRDAALIQQARGDCRRFW